MDGQRFDDITRLFGFSLNRKRFVALVGGLLGAKALASPPDGAAKKGRKRRKGRSGGVNSQGGGVCDAFCSGTEPDPRFCGSFGNCGSDDDCIAQDPSRPICCTQSPGCGGAGEGACCAASAVCGGFCDKDADCPDIADCICDESENLCVTQTCGGVCTKDADCQDTAGCFCDVSAERCRTQTCEGACESEEDCAGGGSGCICDDSFARCVTITCGGFCQKDSDCPDLDGCFCDIESNPARVGAEGIPPGTCVSEACPGSCDSNQECAEQGQDSCVCFFGIGVNVSSASEVAAEGDDGGFCGACLGLAAECNGSPECCGQLVCDGGSCQRKQKPKKDRCGKHGQSCQRDNDCCAQAVCFKGKCGEKDTHCKNDSECAQGYSCQGGPLAPGHRRCRKNGRRNRNRRNKNGQKR